MNRDDDLIDFNKEDDFDDSILNKDGYAEYKEYEDCNDYQLDPEIMNSNDKEAPSKGKPTKDNSKKEKRKEKEQTSIAREILSWILTFSLAILVALILKNFIIINAVVPTGSMENTIMSESNLFGNRLAYINSDPKRGDIIIFKYPDNEEEKYVKRIIGLPGEKVTIDEAKVYIDGKERKLRHCGILRNEFLTPIILMIAYGRRYYSHFFKLFLAVNIAARAKLGPELVIYIGYIGSVVCGKLGHKLVKPIAPGLEAVVNLAAVNLFKILVKFLLLVGE